MVADGTCGTLENDLLPARVQQFQTMARQTTQPSQLFEGPDLDGEWAGGAEATPGDDKGFEPYWWRPNKVQAHMVSSSNTEMQTYRMFES